MSSKKFEIKKKNRPATAGAAAPSTSSSGDGRGSGPREEQVARTVSSAAPRPTQTTTAAISVEMGKRDNIVRPRRPNYGTKGRPIQLLANMFPVKFKSGKTIYHYGMLVFCSLFFFHSCRNSIFYFFF